MKRKILRGMGYLVIAIVVLAILNYICNQKVWITKYQMQSDKIPQSFDGFKILQITDLHSIRDTKQKDKLLQKIKQENPDIILITGDYIDASHYAEENNRYLQHMVEIPEKQTIDFTSELVDIGEVYYVYGNHEMMLLDDPEKNAFKVALENLGIHFLNNQKTTISLKEESIELIGLQDPATLYKDKQYAFIDGNQEKMKTILDNLLPQTGNEDTYTILLSHRPEYFEMYAAYPIDLAFTGHTHGGVIRIPFVGGIYAHPQGWFPQYSAGLYQKDRLKMIVGRGIGYSQISLRIFDYPEIVSVILKPYGQF